MKSIELSYFVCATPRFGSSFLCEVLRSTGVAGLPDDYFWNPRYWFERWGVSDFPNFARRLLREGSTANGVFGSKLMWDQFRDTATQFGTLLGEGGARPSDVLAAAFPNVHYVWLTRRNKVRQGISYYRAMETKIWRSTDAAKVPPVDPPFNFEAINSLVQLTTWEDQAWENYFRQNAIEPCVVVYEELQSSPVTVARHVLSYLGIPSSVQLQEGRWQHQPQADAITDDWVERYKACKDASR